MAKQLVRTYVFTPGAAGAGTIIIPGKWDLGQLLLITNATTNAFLYNFADPTFAGTSVTFTRGNLGTSFPTIVNTADGYTTITLAISTSGMLANHNIQIFVERAEQIVRPWPMGTDAFERTRMAAPQSMLDADFEYGLQPTKWQAITTARGYPAIYELPGTDFSSINVTTDASGLSTNQGIQSLITVTTPNNHNISPGQPITVTALDNTKWGYARAQGSFICNSVPSQNVLTYYAKAKVGNNPGDQLQTTYTILRQAGFYTGATLNSPTFATAGSGVSTQGTVTITFPTNHGLVPGNGVLVAISSDNGTNNHNLCQGSFFVETVPSLASITYTARNVGAITGTPLGTVYARPDAYFVHRPQDGGVALGTGGPAHGSQAIRMSKKYIRYQSGKAINYNTGALFAPNYDIRSVTATNVTIGSTIYVTTDDVDHGLQAGAGVQLSGVTTAGYNGVYSVSSVVDERTFTVISTSTLGAISNVSIQDPVQVSHIGWHGSTVRAGTFDDQNGIFFQYDGIQMAAILRSATFQTAGTVSVGVDSNLVTGLNSRFDSQLVAGDRVVIKGMTHVVTNITSSTWLYVNPAFRGVQAVSGTKMTKIIEKVFPQSQWNIDRCDGSNGPFNPSGFYLNPNRMQMIGLQWTWYGAGFIDWMLRGPDGNYITIHRVKNSNVNTEAYMRSGNQPVRYEVTNEGTRTYLTVSAGAADTTLNVYDPTFFPPTGGTVYVDNELISFTGWTGTVGSGTLTGCTRAASLTYFSYGQNRTFSAGAATTHAANSGVLLVSQTATPSISHWGSAFITDGGFDQDRGYIFNYQALNVQAQLRKTTAFAIRLAPSVSDAIVGDIGVRDLINRAQLLLQGLQITAGGSTQTNQAIVVEGVLNPQNYPSNPANITWQPIQGTLIGGNPIGTGQPSFAQIAIGSSITFNNTTTYSTTVSVTAPAGATQISVGSTATMAVGDAVTSFTVGLSGNSLIQSIGAGYIIVTQPLVAPLPASTTTLTFYRNYYAVPGETIFSFVSSPSSKDSIDLTALKELTNTPLGGRGTFPNGPDSLFINVYITQGITLLANLVLLWGEAQA